MAAEAPETLFTALLGVQKEIPRLSLGKTGSGQVGARKDYKYLELDALMDAVLPVLTRNGLIWTTLPIGSADEPFLKYLLIHAATGESIEGSMPLMLDKPTSQGLGSAVTYGRRYALLCVLGAVADRDDDGLKATEQAETTQKIDKSDRPLTDEELKAMRMAIQDSGLSEPLLLSAAGVDKVVRLSHARIIRQKLDDQGAVA